MDQGDRPLGRLKLKMIHSVLSLYRVDCSLHGDVVARGCIMKNSSRNLFESMRSMSSKKRRHRVPPEIIALLHLGNLFLLSIRRRHDQYDR